MSNPAGTERSRCHWVTITDPDAVARYAEAGVGPMVLIPGCRPRLTDPAADCCCDTLEERLRLAEQRADRAEAAARRFRGARYRDGVRR